LWEKLIKREAYYYEDSGEQNTDQTITGKNALSIHATRQSEIYITVCATLKPAISKLRGL